MFTKEERKNINNSFWKGLKKEMKPISNAEGKFINWLQYPTQLNHVYLRLDATNKYATVTFDIQIKDKEIRMLVWEQLNELKKVLEQETGNATQWESNIMNSTGQEISRISWVKENVNLFDKTTHREMYDFYKEKLVGFDRFYQTYKEILFSLLK